MNGQPPPRRLVRAVAALLLLPSLVAPGPLFGQAKQPAPPLPAGFGETIEVNVVNVEVFVTDRKGKRIKGLKKEDFEILEDRRPVKVTNFYAIEEGKIVAGAPEPIATPEPETIAPPLELDRGIPEDQRLHLVLYVDNFNIRPLNRNRVFRSVRDFLQTKVRPGDRVMLVSYDRSLKVRRSFTSDPLVISSALFELETVTGWGVNADSERRDLLSDIRGADEENLTEVLMKARTHAESLANDLSFTLDALKQTVSSLAGLPGRKAILYVSDGVPMTPGEEVFYAIHEKFPNSGAILESHQYSFSRRFQELAAQANANRVTFYALDAGGLRTPTSISAEESQPGSSAMIDSVYWSNIQSSLQLLADETGGKAILNRNDPGPALAETAADFDTYYSLGYAPAGGSGRYHKVDVKLKGKGRGFTVRHRAGYRDKTPEARMGDGVMASLFFDYSSNPLGVSVETGNQRRREDGHYQIEITVRIPIGKLVLLPEGDKQVARVRLFLAAMDEEGGLSEVQSAPIPISVPLDQIDEAQAKNWAYTFPLLMRAGGNKLAVGLRDDLAAASSFVLTQIQVGRS